MAPTAVDIEPGRRPTAATFRAVARRCGAFLRRELDKTPLFLGPALPVVEYRCAANRRPTPAACLHMTDRWHFQIEDGTGKPEHYAWASLRPRMPARIDAIGGPRLARLVGRALRHAARHRELEVHAWTSFPGYAMSALRASGPDGAVYIIADPPSRRGFPPDKAAFAQTLQCGKVVAEEVLFAWLAGCPPAYGLRFPRRPARKKTAQPSRGR